MPNYQLARQYADVVRTFAVAETNEFDSGKGIFNMPLSFFTANYKRFGNFGHGSQQHTQTDAEVMAMATYLDDNKWFSQTPSHQDGLVEAYHLGIDNVFNKQFHQPDYVAAWHIAAGKVHGSANVE